MKRTANKYGMIKLSIEKFVDYLTPILNELEVDTILLTHPACFDRDGYHYVAKSTRLLYGYGTDWTEEEAFKKMAYELKNIVEVRIKTDKHYNEKVIDRIGIYQIQIQETKGWGPESDDISIPDDIIGVWCRYSFPKVIDKN